MKTDLTDDADQQVVYSVIEYRRDTDELARAPTAQVFRFCTVSRHTLVTQRDR